MNEWNPRLPLIMPNLITKALAKASRLVHMHGYFVLGAVIAFPPHLVPSIHNYGIHIITFSVIRIFMRACIIMSILYISESSMKLLCH